MSHDIEYRPVLERKTVSVEVDGEVYVAHVEKLSERRYRVRWRGLEFYGNDEESAVDSFVLGIKKFY
ncbi:MAG: hypothetical protein DRP12_00080 [Candidatus Aenigmatarchaeota archaeon]|nr:MAG: hypothetical protein DRP12_00080 [Candidatus Aenigmarchaeota archaeon]